MCCANEMKSAQCNKLFAYKNHCIRRDNFNERQTETHDHLSCSRRCSDASDPLIHSNSIVCWMFIYTKNRNPSLEIVFVIPWLTLTHIQRIPIYKCVRLVYGIGVPQWMYTLNICAVLALMSTMAPWITLPCLISELWTGMNTSNHYCNSFVYLWLSETSLLCLFCNEYNKNIYFHIDFCSHFNAAAVFIILCKQFDK